MAVRSLHNNDIEDVLRIDSQSNPHPWKVNSLRECLFNDVVLVAESEGKVSGFAIFYNAVDALELLLVVTDKEFRRRGLARMLLAQGIKMAAAEGFESVLLEVRRSNVAAQSLYSSLGFQQDGVRRNYYPYGSGHEDALLYSIQVKR